MYKINACTCDEHLENAVRQWMGRFHTFSVCRLPRTTRDSTHWNHSLPHRVAFIHLISISVFTLSLSDEQSKIFEYSQFCTFRRNLKNFWCLLHKGRCEICQDVWITVLFASAYNTNKYLLNNLEIDGMHCWDKNFKDLQFTSTIKCRNKYLNIDLFVDIISL